MSSSKVKTPSTSATTSTATTKKKKLLTPNAESSTPPRSESPPPKEPEPQNSSSMSDGFEVEPGLEFNSQATPANSPLLKTKERGSKRKTEPMKLSEEITTDENQAKKRDVIPVPVSDADYVPHPFWICLDHDVCPGLTPGFLISGEYDKARSFVQSKLTEHDLLKENVKPVIRMLARNQPQAIPLWVYCANLKTYEVWENPFEIMEIDQKNVYTCFDHGCLFPYKTGAIIVAKNAIDAQAMMDALLAEYEMPLFNEQRYTMNLLQDSDECFLFFNDISK